MRHIRKTIQALLLLEAAKFSLGLPSQSTAVMNYQDAHLSERRLEAEPRGMHHDDDHPVDEPKSKPWMGYYDFLITEGSYKFWVVFELFTVAVLVYSAFAALYYAKYTATDFEYDDDYFFKKRRLRSIQQPPSETTFLGLTPRTYLRIFQAITELGEQYAKEN